jgi:hypothetical protein
MAADEISNIDGSPVTTTMTANCCKRYGLVLLFFTPFLIHFHTNQLILYFFYHSDFFPAIGGSCYWMLIGCCGSSCRFGTMATTDLPFSTQRLVLLYVLDSTLCILENILGHLQRQYGGDT